MSDQLFYVDAERNNKLTGYVTAKFLTVNGEPVVDPMPGGSQRAWNAMTAYVPGLAETDLKKVVLAIQQLAAGRSNAVGSVTLATGSSTTTVSTPNCATGSTPILTPATASAAAELGGGTMYVSAVDNRSFIYGRKGWLRALDGYEQRHVILDKRLD